MFPKDLTKYSEFKGLTIQQCAEIFKDGDYIYLPEDVINPDDEDAITDMACSIFSAIDYSNWSDYTPCQKRVARKDWILRRYE